MSPRVTLADQGLTLGATPFLAKVLAGGRLPHTITIDNLAVIEEKPYGHDVCLRVGLAAPRSR